jgi:hypothetical protein
MRTIGGYAAILLILLPLNLPAQDPDALLVRLADGDWVWSSRTLREDSKLYGFALGFVRDARLSCPGVGSDAEDHQFLLQTLGHSPNLVADAAAVTASTIELQARGRDNALKLIADVGCDHEVFRRLATNARRFVSGRRPAYGGPTVQSMLVDERISPLSGRHTFDRTYDGMQSPALLLLERDLKSTGLNILECRYDSAPSGVTLTVQYYWSTTSPLASLVSTRTLQFISTAQRQLQQANGHLEVRHPFLGYGSPRGECPSGLDAGLPVKTIDKPRTAAGNATVTAVEPPTRRLSRRSFGQARYVYAYGAVPRGFVPPLPEDVPMDWWTITMDLSSQRAIGSLTFVEVTALSTGLGLLARSPMYFRERGDKATADILEEDHLFAYWLAMAHWMRRNCPGDRTSTFCDQPVPRTADPDIQAALARGETGYLLRCAYAASATETRVVPFWYLGRPEPLEPVRLRSRLPDHPILEVRSPRATCPSSLEAALR